MAWQGDTEERRNVLHAEMHHNGSTWLTCAFVSAGLDASVEPEMHLHGSTWLTCALLVRVWEGDYSQ